MKKSLSWKTLFSIGLPLWFIGRFILGGVIGSGVQLIGSICVIFGIINLIIFLFKKSKK